MTFKHNIKQSSAFLASSAIIALLCMVLFDIKKHEHFADFPKTSIFASSK